MRGLRARWENYNYKTALPEYVAIALRNGYRIVHKGVLAWAPLPSPANVPMFRLLFIAIEATFTFLFWSMRSKDKDYGMGVCCPWSQESFSYSGLCSHNPLTKGVEGNFKLSSEQYEAIAAAIKEKNRKYRAKYYQVQKARDPEKARERERESRQRQDPKTLLARTERCVKRVKEAKKYYCAICKQGCSKPYEFERHNAGKRHLLNVAKAAASVKYKYKCTICA